MPVKRSWPKSEPPPGSLPTRFSLLRRLKDWADQGSWQEFFDTYWQLIYNVARKAGLTDAQAQEVVQETMLAVARNIGAFQADPARGSFKAWLLRQTHWQIAAQFRQQGKQERHLVQSAAPATDPRAENPNRTDTLHRLPDPRGAEIERLWDEEWSNHRMTIALERVKLQVSVKAYQLFDLTVLQSMSATDTARALGVSLASVYMAKHRIRALLKKELQKLDQDKWDTGSENATRVRGNQCVKPR